MLFLISLSDMNETYGTHGVLMVRISFMRRDLVGGKKKPVGIRFFTQVLPYLYVLTGIRCLFVNV